MIYNWSLNK